LRAIGFARACRLDAEVRALNLGTFEQFARQAFGDDAPFLEHVGAV
jgi:hypothetical protein